MTEIHILANAGELLNCIVVACFSIAGIALILPAMFRRY